MMKSIFDYVIYYGMKFDITLKAFTSHFSKHTGRERLRNRGIQ